MGDFNIDLINYASDTNTANFYDLLCTHNFRPLILQPTRVTSGCHSLGGNITSSDHFFQFCQTDILRSSKHSKRVIYARDNRNFNKHEFNEELLNINWPDIINEMAGTEISYQRFFNKLEEILNLMPPYRKMTQKEIRLEKRPWLTRGLLVSRRIRDNLRKQITCKQDPVIKADVSCYTIATAMTVNQQRDDKTNYYTSFFQEIHGNVKTTWDGIRSLINVSTQKCTPPTKIIYNNEVMTSDIDIGNSFNDFFTKIGSRIEAKISKSKKNFLSFLHDSNNKNVFL